VLTTYEEQIEMDEDFIPQETSYRKGYYNGYERAVLDLQAMIREGFQPEQAIMASLEFVIADLKDWRYGNLETRVIPPQINPRK
jgi:hypothetical protein